MLTRYQLSLAVILLLVGGLAAVGYDDAEKTRTNSNEEKSLSCARRADERFQRMGYVDHYITGEGLNAWYSSYYNPKWSRCFMDLTTINGTSSSTTEHDVRDAFSNRKITQCSISFVQKDGKDLSLPEICSRHFPGQAQKFINSKDMERIAADLMGDR